MVGNALKIAAQFHCGNHLPQIRRHRLKPQQQFDAGLVHLLLEQVDFLVVRNREVAQVAVAPNQALHGVAQVALSEARHHQHIVAQRAQGVVKSSKNVPCRCLHLLQIIRSLALNQSGP